MLVRLFRCVFSGLAILLLFQRAFAQPRYTIHDIGPVEGGSIIPASDNHLAINSLGQVVGTFVNGNG